MDILSGLTLAAPAGINAYIPLLAVAVAQHFGWMQLRAPFNMLGEWWAIAIIAALLIVEIVADKVPAVDHVNDGIQTFVRPAAGGILAVAASGQAGQTSPVLMLVAGILVAGGMHSVKAAARPVINATTAGTGAPVVSTVEDVGAAALTVIAIVAPLLALLFILGLVMAVVLAVRSWRRRRAARAVSSTNPPGSPDV